MNDIVLKYGDYVKWVGDVDKVYSQYTKQYVGRIGQIISPEERSQGSTPRHNTPDCFDVRFAQIEDSLQSFVVWNIEAVNLLKTEVTV